VNPHALKETARKTSAFMALTTLTALAPGACATEPGIVPPSGYGGGTAATGPGGSGAGGSSGTSGGGGTSSGDASSSGGTGSDACPGPKALEPMGLPACPDDIRCVDIPSSSSPEGGTSQRVCVNSRCVPIAAIPDPTTVGQLPNCPMADTKCVPDIFVEVNGKFLLKSCRSLMDAEGRCVPVSLPAVRAQAGRLPQGGCAPDERCAPCYDPITGEKTGACEAGCGPDTTEAAKVFGKCCTNRGTCVPLSVAGSIANNAPGDTCPAADASDPEKCVPTARAQNPDMKFPSCMAAAFGIFPAVPGGCVPDCIVTDPVQKGVLVQATCGTGELCAPCVSPLDQKRTGACD
jgi:hypothetical protein